MASITRSTCFVGTPVSVKSAGVRSARLARATVTVRAEKKEFDLFKLAGGRGIAAGEKSLKTEEGAAELWKDPARDMPAPKEKESAKNWAEGDEDVYVGSGRYMKANPKKLPNKEDLGFFIGATGGFAGGEELLWDLRDEIKGEEKAKKQAKVKTVSAKDAPVLPSPMLMPGMNAIVTQELSPYHNFTGIVQRVTDGKAMLLFEGGNWDKSATFPLEQLERSKDGPPGLNPKSAIIMEKVKALELSNEADKEVAVKSSGL